VFGRFEIFSVPIVRLICGFCSVLKSGLKLYEMPMPATIAATVLNVSWIFSSMSAFL
jgi:hypothetical protein